MEFEVAPLLRKQLIRVAILFDILPKHIYKAISQREHPDFSALVSHAEKKKTGLVKQEPQKPDALSGYLRVRRIFKKICLTLRLCLWRNPRQMRDK